MRTSSAEGTQEGAMHVPFSYSGGGTRRLFLDSSIYTAALVSPLALGSDIIDCSTDGLMSTMVYFITPYACLLLNFVLQVSFTHFHIDCFLSPPI